MKRSLTMIAASPIVGWLTGAVIANRVGLLLTDEEARMTAEDILRACVCALPYAVLGLLIWRNPARLTPNTNQEDHRE